MSIQEPASDRPERTFPMERPRSVQPTYDPAQDLFLTFRHANSNGERSMVRLRMPDMIIGELMFDYFVRMGLPVKLVQPTKHGDIERILREAHSEKS